jgi:Ring finger domain
MNRNRGYNPYNPRGNNPYYFPQSTRTQNNNLNNNLLGTIHELIIMYNDNIRLHNHIIDEYNHNIFNILNILQYIQGTINANKYNNTTYSTANTTRPIPTPGTPTRRSNNIDLSALFYLLNIPIHPNYDNENRYVALTQEQINNSTIITNYNTENFTEISCPISLDDFVVGEEICQIRGCGHYFKKNHIMRWFQNNHLCPVCRYNVRNNQQQNSTDGSQNVNRSNSSENMTSRDFTELLQTSDVASSVTPLMNQNLPSMENFARIIGDIILEQIPNSSVDPSNNLMYTFEIPYPSN